MWSIKCGYCQFETDAERFFTPQKNRFLCPSCRTVWRIERHGVPVVTESGFVIPPKNVCVVESQKMLSGV